MKQGGPPEPLASAAAASAAPGGARGALARWIGAPELAALVASVQAALGGAVAVYDADGAPLAGDAAAGPPRRTLAHGDAVVAGLAARGARAEAALDLLATTLGLVVHQAAARDRAAVAHEDALRRALDELSERNARLARAFARLEEVDRLKSTFLATMSHELRTPLTSILGYAELLSTGIAGPVSPAQREHLATILGKADQLLGLITALLEVASLQAGTLTLELAPIVLGEVVRAELAGVAGEAERRGIAVALDVAPAEASVLVVGDRRKLRQVVASLLSNAVKFTPDRGRVEVALRRGGAHPADGASPPALHLVVRDTGIGVPRDLAAKIFEPFYQVDSSTTRAFGGPGLGLTLAKAYVEAHGGRIWVEPAPGAGSVFVATFPIEGLPRDDGGAS